LKHHHDSIDLDCVWLQFDSAGPTLVRLVADRAVKYLAELQQLPTNKTLALPDISIGLEMKNARIVQLLTAADTGISQMVLLHGMAGMGKTTVAKSVLNKLNQLDNTVPCHFARLNPEMQLSSDMVPAQQALLEELVPYADVPAINTAEGGRQLLAARLQGKKVLLVVDNAWGQQLSWLLPGNIMEVLGEGSMVLVTSRESAWAMREFGRAAAVQEVEMDFLTQQESLELFCRHAYGSSTYPAGDEEPVTAIVARCGGLPLALEVVGTYLSDDKDVWGFFRRMEEALSFVYSNELASRFERQQTVFDALCVSWEVLDAEQQEALLDIVWFLQGQPLQLVEHLCGREVLDRLKCLGLVNWPPVEVGSTSLQPVSVHVVLVDFCKLLARGDYGMRLELLGDAVDGCSIEDVLSMVRCRIFHEVPYIAAYLRHHLLQVSEARGLWLRGWQLLECDSTALSGPAGLAGLSVLQMECGVPGEQLCMSLPSLRWLWMEGAAAVLDHPPSWSLHIQVRLLASIIKLTCCHA
jgi:hypothetical protein